MPRSRGFGSRTVRAGVPRRQSDWGIGTQTGVDGSAQELTASGSLLATGGVSTTLPGLTLVRTRGECLLFLSNATAANDGFDCAFGIGVVTDEAFAAGIVSIPTPITDEGSDIWLYHRYFSLSASSPLSGAAAVDRTALSPATAVFRFTVDSKAMRKLTVQDTIFAALEVVERGTATLRWHFNSRSLFKLS